MRGAIQHQVLVTELPPDSGRCMTCDTQIPEGPFLRIMAGPENEVVPAGTVGDECEPCARRYGRGVYFNCGERDGNGVPCEKMVGHQDEHGMREEVSHFREIEDVELPDGA